MLQVGAPTPPSVLVLGPLVLSLAQADLAAVPVPAGAAGPPCSRPQHGETGPGSVQQHQLHQGTFAGGTV